MSETQKGILFNRQSSAMTLVHLTILLSCLCTCTGMSFTWLDPPRRQSLVKDVSFLVKLDVEKLVPTNGKVMFDFLERNIGNGYNKADRSFTAPVSGKYFFTLILQNADKFGFSDYCIMKKSFNVQSILSCTTLTMPFDQKSITLLVPLKFGDAVFVMKTFDSGHNSSLRGSRYWSSFQGELLKPEVSLS